MSYLGYVMSALLNDDLLAQDRRTSRRRRRREKSATVMRQRAARPTADAEVVRGAEIVRPRKAVNLGA